MSGAESCVKSEGGRESVEVLLSSASGERFTSAVVLEPSPVARDRELKTSPLKLFLSTCAVARAKRVDTSVAVLSVRGSRKVTASMESVTL